MQCERLIKLTKSWYLKVREETMAPARMISFMEQHVATCDICADDPDLPEELAKIKELVLPESKIPKASRIEEDEEVAPESDEERDEENDEEEDEDEFEDDEDDEI